MAAAGGKVIEAGTLSSLACRYPHRGVVGNCWRGGHLRPVKKVFVGPALAPRKPPVSFKFNLRGQLPQPRLGYSCGNPFVHAGWPDIQHSGDGCNAAEQINNFPGVCKHAGIISEN